MSSKEEEQTLYRQVEDAFFGILWTLQTKRKNDLVNLNLLACLGGMLLDFCHMLAFFVHSKSIYCYINFRRYCELRDLTIRLRMGLYHDYLGNVCKIYSVADTIVSLWRLCCKFWTCIEIKYAFWVAVAIAVLIAINAVVVGYSFWTKNFNQLWAIKLLHFVVAIVFNFAFIASFYLLSTPWYCDPNKLVLIPFHENGQE